MTIKRIIAPGKLYNQTLDNSVWENRIRVNQSIYALYIFTMNLTHNTTLINIHIIIIQNPADDAVNVFGYN